MIATLIVWAAVAWPIAGLMLRSLYGALSGRLVVRLRAVNAGSFTLGSCPPSRRRRLPAAPTTRTSRRSSRARRAASRSARTAWCTRRSASSAATARACRAARSCASSPPRRRRAIAPPLGTALAARHRAGRAQRLGLRLLRLPGRVRRRGRDGRGRHAHERLLPRPRVGRDRRRRQLLAYVIAWQAVPILYSHAAPRTNWVTLQFVFGVVAAVVAYRRVSDGPALAAAPRPPRGRRAASWAARSSLLDRRRRRRDRLRGARQRPARGVQRRALLPRGPPPPAAPAAADCHVAEDSPPRTHSATPAIWPDAATSSLSCTERSDSTQARCPTRAP